jgi:hypothetical protein
MPDDEVGAAKPNSWLVGSAQSALDEARGLFRAVSCLQCALTKKRACKYCAMCTYKNNRLKAPWNEHLQKKGGGRGSLLPSDPPRATPLRAAGPQRASLQVSDHESLGAGYAVDFFTRVASNSMGGESRTKRA